VSGFPHCDQRILHAPGECEYCDRHPGWQGLRNAWGIAFTGHEPVVSDHRAELPCPADFNRPPTGEGPDHRRWAGNVATTQAPVNESAASRMMYGEHPVDRKMRLSREPATARQNTGFMDRLRANVAKHRDLLDRLR
jgi:hypothetical protein